jgi:hypothetical protein
MLRPKVISSVCLAATCSLSLAVAAAADTVVVTADRMVDVLAGRVVDHPQITITDGRISAVGSPGATLPGGTRRVDLPSVTLLPGLIDMHTHITGDPRYSGYRGLEFTDNFWTVVGVANAEKTRGKQLKPVGLTKPMLRNAPGSSMAARARNSQDSDSATAYS